MQPIEPRLTLPEHMPMHETDAASDTDLRIGDAACRGARVVFRFDGRDIVAYEGESVAAALLAAGIRSLASAAAAPPRRTVFCAMGICQQCVVLVDGARVEACRQPVRDGLVVHTMPEMTRP